MLKIMGFNTISMCLFTLLLFSGHSAIVIPDELAPVSEAGYWGNFSNIFAPPSTQYAICGANMRFEKYNDTAGFDNTAANGVKLKFCNRYHWDSQQQGGMDGFWGNWMGMKMCPYKSFVNGFRARIQQPQGKSVDDTALNGLQLNCYNPDAKYNTRVMVYEGVFGTWRNWLYAGSNNQQYMYFFNSARFRLEAKQGKGDDTALNGIEMTPIKWGVNDLCQP